MQSKFAQSMTESPPLIQFQKHFEFPACYILAEFHFSGPEYHTSQNVIDKNWPHKKKTVKCQTIFFFSLFSYDPGHCSSSSDLMKNPWIYWMYIQVAVHVEDRELFLYVNVN